MKFQDLSEQQILELFESAPIEDLNLLHKFYKVYKHVVLALVEAFSGYAYQKDLYEVYKAFYAPKKLSYASFSRILGEMEEANLIGAKNGNPKVVFLKQKSYELIGKNQTTIHSSRINNRSMKKAKMLAQLHMTLLEHYKEKYHPTKLKRSVSNSSIYVLTGSNVERYFFFCLKERQKSEELKAEVAEFLGSCNFNQDKRFHLHLVFDEETKRYDSAFEKLSNASNLQYWLTAGRLRLHKQLLTDIE